MIGKTENITILLALLHEQSRENAPFSDEKPEDMYPAKQKPSCHCCMVSFFSTYTIDIL